MYLFSSVGDLQEAHGSLHLQTIKVTNCKKTTPDPMSEWCIKKVYSIHNHEHMPKGLKTSYRFFLCILTLIGLQKQIITARIKSRIDKMVKTSKKTQVMSQIKTLIVRAKKVMLTMMKTTNSLHVSKKHHTTLKVILMISGLMKLSLMYPSCK